MKKLAIEQRHAPVRYLSYIVGFVLSVITTLVAYFFVVNGTFPAAVLLYVVAGLAVIQLVVQVVFFLHIGRGSHWKLITFLFTAVFVVIVVVGTIWVMNNLNYNMMDMSSEEMQQYMEQNEGI